MYLLKEYQQSEVESVWINMRPHAIPRSVSTILLGVVYQSTANRELENVIFWEHIQSNIDNFLMKHPNAMVIATGDFNATSTGLDPKSVSIPNHLKQLVASGILDWFCTNRSHLFHLQRIPKVAASDHYTILARLTEISPPKQDSIRRIRIRQCWANDWRDFGSWMTGKDWSEIFSAPSCAQNSRSYHKNITPPWRLFSLEVC